MDRRAFLGLAAAAALAGCQTTTLLEENAADELVVRKVTVDATAFAGVTGRVNEFSREQVTRDLQATLGKALRTRAKGNRQVDVVVYLTHVHLVSPGQSLVLGGSSSIAGVLQVVDVRTGDEVLKRTNVVGTAKGVYAPGGVIGALTTRSVDMDYRHTVVGFVSDVERKLFGSSEPKTGLEADKAKVTKSESAGPELSEAERRELAEAKARIAKCRAAVTNSCKDIPVN